VARTITLNWARFVRALCNLPEPRQSELAVTEDAQSFLEQILAGNLAMVDVLHLPEEVLDRAWAIILADGGTDALAEQAQMSVDDNLWFELIRDCLRFDGICDPTIGSEFL